MFLLITWSSSTSYITLCILVSLEYIQCTFNDILLDIQFNWASAKFEKWLKFLQWFDWSVCFRTLSVFSTVFWTCMNVQYIHFFSPDINAVFNSPYSFLIIFFIELVFSWLSVFPLQVKGQNWTLTIKLMKRLERMPRASRNIPWT